MKKLMWMVAITIALMFSGCGGDDNGSGQGGGFFDPTHCQATWSLTGSFPAFSVLNLVTANAATNTKLELVNNGCPEVGALTGSNFPLTVLQSNAPAVFVIDLSGILLVGSIEAGGAFEALLTEVDSNAAGCRMKGEINGKIENNQLDADLTMTVSAPDGTHTCTGWI